MSEPNEVEQLIEDVQSDLDDGLREFDRTVTDLLIEPVTNPSTEEALFTFQSVAGAGGFVAGAIAASRLDGVEEDAIGAPEILAPAGIAILGTSLSAFLIPDGSRDE